MVTDLEFRLEPYHNVLARACGLLVQWWRYRFRSGRLTMESFFHEAIYFNNRPNANCVA